LGQHGGVALARVRLSEKETAARMRVEEANRTKDGFLSLVSQEMRAPLTSIVAWTRSLRRRPGAKQEERAHALDIVEQSAQAQARIVDDILGMSRMVAGTLKLEMKPTDLRPIVEASVNELVPVACAEGIELAIGPVADAKVLVDADRVRQVLHTLLSNAFRSTPSGGHVLVEVEAGERAMLRISDDGKGGSPAELHRAFDVYYQPGSPAEQRQHDVGLGMTVARHIVHQHGGTLRIVSKGRGRGTTATVDLPLAPVVEPRPLGAQLH
jgi:signal transduction histidine kinase